MTAPDGASEDYLGVTSQSGNILTVGAYQADTGGLTDAGAAYTFDISGHITAIQIEGNSTEVNTAGTTNWVKMKTITLAADSTVKEVKNELKNDSTNGAWYTECKILFNYSDGTQLESSIQSHGNQSYLSQTYTNPNQFKFVQSIEVWLRQSTAGNDKKAWERNTAVWGTSIGSSNSAPTITSSNTVSIPENQQSVITVQANDPEGSAISYSVTGGTDQSLFSIDSTSGLLNLIHTPNYEAPRDSDSNNTYEVTVRASDGSIFNEQTINVHVLDINENSIVGVNTTENKSNYPVDGTNWINVKTISVNGLLIDQVENEIKNDSANPSWYTECKINFLYGDGSSAYSSVQTESSDTYTGNIYTNPNNAKTVNQIDIWLRQNHTDAGAEAWERNTIAYGTLPNSTQLESNSSLQITNGATDWLQIKSITTNGNIVDIIQNEIKNDSTSSNWITESKINFLYTDGNSSFSSVESHSSNSFLQKNYKNPYLYKPVSQVQVWLRQSHAGNDKKASEQNTLVFGKLNTAPSDLNSTTTLSILENQPIGSIVGEFNATDPDAGATLSYSLVAGAGDGNNSLFTLETNGTLKTAAILDYESGAILSIRVKVQDENNASNEGNFTVQVTNQNEAPVITNGTAITLTLQEDGNLTDSTLVATDPDNGDVLTWTFTPDHEGNGSINLSGTGNSPAFLYTPNEHHFGNDFFTARVTDTGGLYYETNVTINITAVNDPPIFLLGNGGPNANIQSQENQKLAALVNVLEPDDGILTFSITGGADQNLFSIDASTGELNFNAAPDFEYPTDANNDNVYEVIVTATDSTSISTSQNLSVSVTDMIDLSTYIFNNAGSVGAYGPSQAMIDSAYQGTILQNQVVINTQGIQEFTVPFSGLYTVQALGAQGGAVSSTQGGLGASISGVFSLTAGETLHILVGQMGTSSSSGSGAGGGTFVTRFPHNTNASILVIAGGGGGVESGSSVFDGVTTQNGGSNGSVNGGTNGNGGQNDHGHGGSGFFTSPTGNTDHGGTFPLPYVNGGVGGLNTYNGGFGGGGAGASVATGGGGGYSGGASGGDHSGTGGGGGGSYNSGTNQLNQAGANAGHGKVIISALNTPPSDISLSNHSLPENLPANIQVGLFSTTDPDDTNGTGAYTYSLVSGTGDTDNALFNLDPNGTLTILSTSGYEQRLIDSNTTALLHNELNASFLEANYSADLHLTPQIQYPTWSIRVRTADDVNASYEEVILIASLDRDDTIPIITFDGNGTRTQTPWTYIPSPIYDAYDNVDGNITHLVITDGNLTTEQPGTYYLHHDVMDAAGNNATRVTFALTVVNQNPTDVHLSNSFVEENLPVGTHVGIFTTTDPDDMNNTRLYSYELVIDTNKTLPPFNLDINGSLSTTAVLDFETVENYTIRVRTTDQFSGFYEEDFIIYVVDAFPPYVETGDAILGISGEFTLNGNVVDEGGISGILERGFIVSTKPITNLQDSGITRLISSVDDNNFTSVFSPLISGKKHFYRAYAINAESDYLGTEKSFTPVAIPGPGYWSDAKPIEGAPDWWESSWFGTYYSAIDNQWIMHSELGWLYPSPTRDFGIWFWKEELNWLWTNYETFPFLYSIDEGSWLYFYGKQSDQRLFYSYLAKKWIVLTGGQLIDAYSSSLENPDNPDTGSEKNSTLNGGQE